MGGAVRDALLSRPTKDYDFVVRKVPLVALERFLKRLGTVNYVGKKFGVLKFIPKNEPKSGFEPFDIALPRQEVSTNNTGHYRDFTIKSDHRLPIQDDLSRRDFTMNALAYNLATGEIVDPFGGIVDIQTCKIRTVGVAEERFAEDYSRMLRAIRFACQLGFRIEAKTARAIRRCMSNINKQITLTNKISTKKRDANIMRAVPYEVIAKELLGAFTAHPVAALDICSELGVFRELIPEVEAMKKCKQPPRWHSEGDVFAHTRLALQALTSSRFKKEFPNHISDALLIFSVLFHDIGKPMTIKTPARDGVDRIRFDGHDRVGAESARRIAEQLRLQSVASAAVDPSRLAWLIQNHLLLLNSDLKKMKNNTIERYFFRDEYLGTTLLKLIFADSCGSVTEKGALGLDRYRAFKRRLKSFFMTSAARKKILPKPLVNGYDVMKVCVLSPGPIIKTVLERVREEQLSGRIKTKKDALIFLKQNPPQTL